MFVFSIINLVAYAYGVDSFVFGIDYFVFERASWLVSHVEYGFLLASALSLFFILIGLFLHIAAARPFFMRKNFGFLSHRLNSRLPLYNISLKNPCRIIIFLLLVPFFSYSTDLIISGDVMVAMPFLLPFAAIIFLAYDGSNRLRRSPIVELHHNALGFLAYYEAYGMIVELMHRNASKTHGEKPLVGYFSTAGEALKWRLMREQERSSIEREFLILFVSVMSAFAAFAPLVGLLQDQAR